MSRGPIGGCFAPSQWQFLGAQAKQETCRFRCSPKIFADGALQMVKWDDIDFKPPTRHFLWLLSTVLVGRQVLARLA
jgi:hypothetical protein